MHCTHVPDEVSQRSRGGVVQSLSCKHATQASKFSLQFGVGAWQLVGVCTQAFVVSLQESWVQNKLSSQVLAGQAQVVPMQSAKVQKRPSSQFASWFATVHVPVGHVWARATPPMKARQRLAATQEDVHAINPCNGCPSRFHPSDLDSIVITPQPLLSAEVRIKDARPRLIHHRQLAPASSPLKTAKRRCYRK